LPQQHGPAEVIPMVTMAKQLTSKTLNPELKNADERAYMDNYPRYYRITNILLLYCKTYWVWCGDGGDVAADAAALDGRFAERAGHTVAHGQHGQAGDAANNMLRNSMVVVGRYRPSGHDSNLYNPRCDSKDELLQAIAEDIADSLVNSLQEQLHQIQSVVMKKRGPFAKANKCINKRRKKKEDEEGRVVTDSSEIDYWYDVDEEAG
ncbi:hypothetical protein PV325_006376, partial [Microctonus aethiopoides]